jgi:predicted ATPase
MMYLAMGKVVQGCLAVRSGDFETGVNTLKNALPDYCATSARSLLSVFLSFLAEGLSRCGKSEEAFATLAEALKISETSLEVYWEAELYRLKGEMTLQSRTSLRQVQPKFKTSQEEKGKRQKAKLTNPQPLTPSPHSEAEACFQKAIEVARNQGAKSLELRAVMSLARLWRQQGKHHEARATLSEIYGWFTEGFETADLKDARTMLKELS